MLGTYKIRAVFSTALWAIVNAIAFLGLRYDCLYDHLIDRLAC